jgi:hypothetical protein
MNGIARTAALTAVLTLGLPALASAQDPAQTQLLATMRQQIPQDTLSVVSVGALSRSDRIALLGRLTPRGAAALHDALGRATVATEDRPNGVSEDQVTLAEYLQGLGIDPARVVGVTIAMHVDRENPPVTVYYSGSPPR